MKLAVLLLASLSLTLSAADQPRQLDPTKPEDAVLVLDQVTRDQTMTRANGVAVTMALQTLAKVVQEQTAAKAEADAKVARAAQEAAKPATPPAAAPAPDAAPKAPETAPAAKK